MPRYDTTPTDDDRAKARAWLADINEHGPGGQRMAYAYGWLAGTVEELTEGPDELQARSIARARAMVEALREMRR